MRPCWLGDIPARRLAASMLMPSRRRVARISLPAVVLSFRASSLPTSEGRSRVAMASIFVRATHCRLICGLSAAYERRWGCAMARRRRPITRPGRPRRQGELGASAGSVEPRPRHRHRSRSLGSGAGPTPGRAQAPRTAGPGGPGAPSGRPGTQPAHGATIHPPGEPDIAPRRPAKRYPGRQQTETAHGAPVRSRGDRRRTAPRRPAGARRLGDRPAHGASATGRRTAPRRPRGAPAHRRAATLGDRPDLEAVADGGPGRLDRADR